MPKRRDPTLMESLQREDARQSQLRASAGQNLSPSQGVQKGLKPTTPEGMIKRGLPR